MSGGGGGEGECRGDGRGASNSGYWIASPKMSPYTVITSIK